jgi:hypothetical protein
VIHASNIRKEDTKSESHAAPIGRLLRDYDNTGIQHSTLSSWSITLVIASVTCSACANCTLQYDQARASFAPCSRCRARVPVYRRACYCKLQSVRPCIVSDPFFIIDG